MRFLTVCVVCWLVMIGLKAQLAWQRVSLSTTVDIDYELTHLNGFLELVAGLEKQLHFSAVYASHVCIGAFVFLVCCLFAAGRCVDKKSRKRWVRDCNVQWKSWWFPVVAHNYRLGNTPRGFVLSTL